MTECGTINVQEPTGPEDISLSCPPLEDLIEGDTATYPTQYTNQGPTRVEVTIGILVDGNAAAQETVEVAPGGSGEVVFEVSFPDFGRYTIGVEVLSLSQAEE